MNIFQSGTPFEVGKLAELNEVLRRNANSMHKSAGAVGYPTQGQAASGEFAPLVPQSIQSTIDSATATMRHIVMTPMLPVVEAGSPLHESVVIDEHGSMHLSPFVAEGKAGTRSKSALRRQVVEVKYLAERREITDQATLSNIIAGGNGMVSKSGLMFETERALHALAIKKERNIFWADSDVDSLAFDGLYKQILAGAPNNVEDMRGAAVDPQKLTQVLQSLVGSPNYAFADTIVCDPLYYGVLQAIAQSYGRFAMPEAKGGANLTFGAEGLYIQGAGGPVKVVQAPLMAQEQQPAGSAQGDAPPTFTVSNLVSSVLTAASDASSLFTTSDAGDYRYKIEAVGDGGVAATYTHGSAVTVAPGDRVKFDFDDAAKATAGDNSIRFYRVYRSTKNGAADTCRLMWTFARNTSGASSGTLFYDTNRYIPRTAPIFILSMTPQVMYWLRFLDTSRIPLAKIELTQPFTCIDFGTPYIKTPKKCAILDNVATSI